MNTHNKTLAIGIVFLAALTMLALFTQLTQAQGPDRDQRWTLRRMARPRARRALSRFRGG